MASGNREISIIISLLYCFLEVRIPSTRLFTANQTPFLKKTETVRKGYMKHVLAFAKWLSSKTIDFFKPYLFHS